MVKKRKTIFNIKLRKHKPIRKNNKKTKTKKKVKNINDKNIIRKYILFTLLIRTHIYLGQKALVYCEGNMH